MAAKFCVGLRVLCLRLGGASAESLIQMCLWLTSPEDGIAWRGNDVLEVRRLRAPPNFACAVKVRLRKGVWQWFLIVSHSSFCKLELLRGVNGFIIINGVF